MQITVNVEAPELVSAIRALAEAISGKSILTQTTAAVTPAPTAPTSVPLQQPIQQPAQAQQPIQQPIQQPVQQPAQIQQPGLDPLTGAAATGTVPTTAQTYTMEQLAVAATQLVDAGRREELVQLLGQFGVQALTMLPKEQYGAFATQLRTMGAKI